MTLTQIAAVYGHPKDEHGELVPQFTGYEEPARDVFEEMVALTMERYGIGRDAAVVLAREEKHLADYREKLNDQNTEPGEIDRLAEVRRLELLARRGR